jgi:hypothetical protein
MHTGLSGDAQSPDVEHSFATHAPLGSQTLSALQAVIPSRPSVSHCCCVVQQASGFGFEHAAIASSAQMIEIRMPGLSVRRRESCLIPTPTR